MKTKAAAILGFFEEAIKSPWTVHYRCVPDEQAAVEAALIELVDSHRCSVVVTTGGTGPAPRDITPEATEAVCDRMMPVLVNRCAASPWRLYQPLFFPAGWGCGANPCSSTSQDVQKPSEKPSMKYGEPYRIVLI